MSHYATVPVPAELRRRVPQRADAGIKASSAHSGQLHAEMRKQLDALDKKEDGYLDLVGDPDWPQ